MTSKSDRSSTSAEAAVQEAYRAHWGRLLAQLVARTRRLDLAEDALGEAFARALSRWSDGGVPDNPQGWIYTTAYRQILGRLRAEVIAGKKAHALLVRQPVTVDGQGEPGEPGAEFEDDRLQLILLCCHPALPVHARSALALRLVVGTPTEQIARLFLVSTATMAARITRAKKKIVAAGIPLASPIDHELEVRLDEVCRTIYLAFTAGYAPGTGSELVRSDIAGDAVRLAEVLAELRPDALQSQAMLSLLLLQHSRRDARTSDGQLVRLADQDRSRWRADEIERGLQLVAKLEPGVGYGEQLRLQALIAAEHVRPTAADETRWHVIADCYRELEAATGSAIVRLNRAIAVAEVEGPVAGLALLETIEQPLDANHRFHAVRGDLLERAGQASQAHDAYAQAARLCENEVERNYLAERRDSITPP